MTALIEGILEGIGRQLEIEAQRRQQNQVVHARSCRAALSAPADIKIKVRK
jgi:hypothetical protein